MGRTSPKKNTKFEKKFNSLWHGQNHSPLKLTSCQSQSYERSEEFWSGKPSQNSSPLTLSDLINSRNAVLSEEVIGSCDVIPLVFWLNVEYLSVWAGLALAFFSPSMDFFCDGQSVPNVQAARRKRGQGGITTLGSRSIRSGAFLMQKKFGKARLALLTLTMPSFGDRQDIVYLLCAEWSVLINRFLEAVDREYEKKCGRRFSYVGCTEIQEERYEKYGHPCPHLHIVYVSCDKPRRWIISADRFREIWKRIIDNRIKALINEDFSDNPISQGRIECEAIKKSAEGYIAKYLSKGVDVCGRIVEDGLSDLLPSAWWHCSLVLKRAVRGLTCELPYDFKLAILDGVDLRSRGVASYLKKVVISGWLVGYVGNFPCLAVAGRDLIEMSLS
jgi:hypothetical protein